MDSNTLKNIGVLNINPEGSVNMNGARIRRLGNPCDNYDAVNKYYVDQLGCSLQSYQPLLTRDTDLFLRSITAHKADLQCLTSEQINASTISCNYMAVEDAIGTPVLSTTKIQLSDDANCTKYSIRADEQGVHIHNHTVDNDITAAISFQLPLSTSDPSSILVDTPNDFYIGTISNPQAICIKNDGQVVIKDVINEESLSSLWTFTQTVDKNVIDVADKLLKRIVHIESYLHSIKNK